MDAVFLCTVSWVKGVVKDKFVPLLAAPCSTIVNGRSL